MEESTSTVFVSWEKDKRRINITQLRVLLTRFPRTKKLESRNSRISVSCDKVHKKREAVGSKGINRDIISFLSRLFFAMLSRMTWTIGWAAYTLWIVKECKRTRELEVGYQPIFAHVCSPSAQLPELGSWVSSLFFTVHTTFK